MKKLVVYGLIMGLLFLVLEVLNFKMLVRQISIELYGVFVGAIFLLFGLWLGVSIVQKSKDVVLREGPSQTDLSDREYEVLQLMALGKSNKEIADQLFVIKYYKDSYIECFFEVRCAAKNASSSKSPRVGNSPILLKKNLKSLKSMSNQCRKKCSFVWC